MIVISKRSVTALAVAAITTLTTNPCFAATPGLEKVDAVGNRIMGIVRGIGYWVIITSCIYSVLGCLKEHDLKKAGQIVLFHVVVYAILYGVPWALRQAEGIF